MAEYASEMRLYDPTTGERLYMDEQERERFIAHSNQIPNTQDRMLCHVLHWTGCRVSEALELTPRRINADKCVIRFRTIKKRKVTKKGEKKAAVFRDVPIPKTLAEQLDLVFGLRQIRKSKKGLDLPLWTLRNDLKKPMGRVTAWRIIKRVMEAAGIEGPQATSKGFRHGFAVSMILGGMDYRLLQKLLGHERPETTAIYLQVTGAEAYDLQMAYWDKANKNWQR